MTANADEAPELLRRALQGDPQALVALFDQHRARLSRMVQLRLDRRLQGRIDPSDVLQEAYLEVARAFAENPPDPAQPIFLWLRTVTGRKLQSLHRHHLGTQARDAGREVSLNRGALPEATSLALAAQLLGHDTTPSEAMARAELQLRVQEAINAMDPLDREVLTLRHFEQLSNAEAAQVLGLSEAAASMRFLRAVRKLKQLLGTVPGFF